MDGDSQKQPNEDRGAFERDSALFNREQQLYKRGAPETPQGIRHRLHNLAKATTAQGWKPPQSNPMKKFLQSPLTYLLGGAALFFVASFLFLLFSLFTDRSVISSDNIEVVVQGPVSVAAGEELTLQVLIQNNNPVAIEAADLSVEYPVGARRADDSRTLIERPDHSFIGTLAPGEAVNRSVHVVLYGETDQEQQFNFVLEYRADGSNAVVEKVKPFAMLLSAAPISLSVSLPESLSTGDVFEGSFVVRSNAPTVLNDVRVTIKYPPGFELFDASPQPSFEQSTFDLGDLAPGATRTITIDGSLIGQDNEMKTFSVVVGTPGPSGAVRVPYNSTLHTLTMVKPSIGAVFTINDKTEEPTVLSVTEDVDGVLTITNNHDTQVIDLGAQLRIVGDVLDAGSVQASGGFFRSLDRTIVWDKGVGGFTGSLDPGESIELPFNFNLISPTARINAANARELKLDLSVTGRLVNPDSTTALDVFSSRTLRVNSNVAMSVRSMHFVGPITNSGFMPPRVNQATTYTGSWAITNGTNDLRNVRATATLPPYVRFTGVVSPQTETVTYDAETRQLTWDAGIVRAGTGTTRPIREVYFQVEVVPSAPQVGQVLTLVGDGVLSAVDTFTNASLRGTTRSLTTLLSADPQYTDGMGEVAP